MRNEQMAAMVAAHAPAEHDLRFEIAVLARIARRRLRRGVAVNLVLGMAAAALLALVMPDLESVWQTRIAAGLSNGAVAALLFGALLPLQFWIVRRA